MNDRNRLKAPNLDGHEQSRQSTAQAMCKNPFSRRRHSRNQSFSRKSYLDLIAENRRRSGLLVVGLFLVLYTLLVAAIYAPSYLVPQLSPSGSIEIEPLGLLAVGALTLAVGTLIVLWAYLRGSAFVLSVSQAHELNRTQDHQVWNVVEELSIAGGIPSPNVYVIESPAINSFSTGRHPDYGAVAITRGLRNRLTKDELAGVIGHEISHIRHRDTLYCTLLTVLAGWVSLCATRVKTLILSDTGRSLGQAAVRLVRGIVMGSIAMILRIGRHGLAGFVAAMLLTLLIFGFFCTLIGVLIPLVTTIVPRPGIAAVRIGASLFSHP